MMTSDIGTVDGDFFCFKSWHLVCSEGVWYMFSSFDENNADTHTGRGFIIDAEFVGGLAECAEGVVLARLIDKWRALCEVRTPENFTVTFTSEDTWMILP